WDNLFRVQNGNKLDMFIIIFLWYTILQNVGGRGKQFMVRAAAIVWAIWTSRNDHLLNSLEIITMDIFIISLVICCFSICLIVVFGACLEKIAVDLFWSCQVLRPNISEQLYLGKLGLTRYFIIFTQLHIFIHGVRVILVNVRMST
ncbi:hypothetical protein ACJX0J_011804, partial [Zea mays]